MSGHASLRLLVLAGIVALTAGCPGTDPLNSSFANVETEVTLVNVAASRFDTTEMVVNQILVQPANPAAQSSAGSSPFGLLSRSVTLDLDGTSGPFEVSPVRLPTGTYEVVAVRLSLLSATDATPPAAPSTCTENFGTLPPDYSSIGVGPSILPVEVLPSNDPVVFSIVGSGNRMAIEFDFGVIADALVAALEPVCRETSTCSFGSGNIVQPPCILVTLNWSLVNVGLADVLQIQVS